MFTALRFNEQSMKMEDVGKVSRRNIRTEKSDIPKCNFCEAPFPFAVRAFLNRAMPVSMIDALHIVKR